MQRIGIVAGGIVKAVEPHHAVAQHVIDGTGDLTGVLGLREELRGRKDVPLLIGCLACLEFLLIHDQNLPYGCSWALGLLDAHGLDDVARTEPGDDVEASDGLSEDGVA